jgi:hypothetical protein
MAITLVDVDTASPADPDRRETARFLVGTGALNPVVAAAVRERPGIPMVL